jgi:ArsR family transcriptional regulator
MFKPADVCDLVHIDPARVGRLRESLVDAGAVQGLADTFRAMGDPTRVRMLDALSHGELCVCDLASVLGLTQSAVSHQLRLLKNLRLVRARRDGRMVFYALDDQHIMSLFRQTLKHVQEPDRAVKPAVPVRPRVQRENGTRGR